MRSTAALLPLVLWGCVLPHPQPGERRAAAPFILTFWCAPPLVEFSDARAAEIAAAGFNTVAPPCEGGTDPERNAQLLATAARHGLRVWIADSRFGIDAPAHAGWESRLAAAVARYQSSAALSGYFVADEPTAADFATLRSVVDQLHTADRTHDAIINLLPDYVRPHELGAESYAAYTDRFVAIVRPHLISYDYYPFGATKDRPTFFDNLATIRAAATRFDVPFMLIVQVMPHGPYRDPSEAEIAWQVFHALAFGAGGVSYFAYWTPTNGTENDRHGLVEDGKPTLHYFQVARLNREVGAIARQLGTFQWLGVADPSGEVAGRFPIGPIADIDGGPVTVGLFEGDAGRFAALLVNRDYWYGTRVIAQPRDGTPAPRIFDAARDCWDTTRRLQFTLPPGGAQLIAWGPPNPEGESAQCPAQLVPTP
jgi:hypothetical protein